MPGLVSGTIPSRRVPLTGSLTFQNSFILQRILTIVADNCAQEQPQLASCVSRGHFIGTVIRGR